MPEKTETEEVLDQVENEELEKSVIASVQRSKDFAVLYSNFVNCGFTAWDVRLNFGLVGVDENGAPNMTELIAVVLTPQLAKALVAALNGHVKAYEHENGEIQMPQSMVREAQARKAQIEAKAKE
jgi:hypothetical protein